MSYSLKFERNILWVTQATPIIDNTFGSLIGQPEKIHRVYLYHALSGIGNFDALEPGTDGDLRLHPYHKSFADFLEELSRAKDLFAPESRVCAHSQIASCGTPWNVPQTWIPAVSDYAM